MSLLVTNTPSFNCISHMGALVIDLSVVTHGVRDVGTDWIVEVDRRNWGAESIAEHFISIRGSG